MSERFALPTGAALRVSTTSGDISLTAEDRSDLEIEAGGRAVAPSTEDDGRTVVIRAPRGGSIDLHIRCPRGVDVSVGTVSGDVHLAGSFGCVRVTTVSGNIDLDTAADVDLRSVSGRLSVVTCRGRCQLNTKSGRISVGGVDGPARASTISGNVELGTSGRGAVAVKTISGGVTIRVPKGKQPRARLRSLSGRVRCECPQGSDFDLEATTVSGRIQVEGS